MAFEPWIGFDTPTPYYVNTGLDNGTNTAGYWFVATDEGDGGKSKVVWPVATGNELNDDSLDPIIDFCKGVCGTADLDKGTLTYQPFLSVGFNVVGEGAEGYPVPGDASSWGGICITYRSDVAPSLELGLGSFDAQIGYALPAKNLNKSKNGESYKKCIPWSDFNQPSWYKGTEKISGTEAATQLVSINFKMQGSQGQYKFKICAIGPYGDGTGNGLPETCSVPLTHPAISVNAKWSKGNDGYDATITVKDGEKELTLGTDYEIETSVNDATGIVIKTITGKGDYAGSVVKSLVPYIDENGVEQTVTDYTVLTSDVDDYIENGVINLNGGWYVVEGEVKYASQVKFSGDAHLILADGATMEIEGENTGIFANGNLTIYGQGGQSGILNASATGDYGIYSSYGNITISGGTVEAKGNYQGIFSDYGVMISGGTVIATGTNGDGIFSSDGNITISGGTVTATGEYFCIYGYSGVTISGGSVTATGEDLVILGYKGVTISGGSVTATGAYGIVSEQGNITINGGTVTATGKIGHGIYGLNGVTISGGSVTATGTNGDGIHSYSGDITLDWTNDTDFIYASRYYSEKGTVSIAEGNSFKDENGKEYSGTIDDVFDIAGKTLVPPSFEGKFLSDVNIAVADIPVQKYADGKPVCPSVVVTDGKDTLTAGTDYTVVCSNNNAVTSATLDEAAIAQITGKGNYVGAIQKRFFIWNNIRDYAAVQVFQDADGKTHAEIDGAYDGTDAVAIDEDFENVAVKFNRKFTVNLENGGFSTIMLPFDIEAKNLTGVKSIFEFAGVFKNNGKNAVGVNYVWCNATLGMQELEKGHDNCNELSGELKAYTPYMVEMDTPTLGIKDNVALKPSNNATNSVVSKSNWVFRGALEKKEWSKEDEDIKNGKIWAFASFSSNGASIGKFVQLDGQNSVNPFQAYLYNLNGKQQASPNELGSMDIVFLADYVNYTAVQIFTEANGNKHAVIDGNYSASADESEAVSIPNNIGVNSVEMTREFPIGKYSTTVLPFDVNTANVEGLDAVLRYNGIKTINGESSVRMKVVWATDKWVKRNDLRDKNNNLIQYDHADLTANTPYLVQMNDATLKLKSEAFPLMLEKTAPADVSIDGWTFRGTWQYKKWGHSCSTEGQNCDRETDNAYGFAASSSDDDKINVGDFVRVGEGAWILPMRAYLVSTDILESTPPAQGVRANGNYVKRPSFAQEELPEFMSIVIDVDDEGKETTVIGQFNTRTGEIKMNYDRGKFDLKGRRVNGTNNARGAYYGKKILNKY